MDIALYYVERGSGFPLLLLHGNGEDGTYFQHQIEHFSARYRVLALDTRGHGRSPRGEAPFTIAQFAEDLYEFMREHTLEKAHILGFSDGGNIALTFALRHPERVEKLILNGANLSPAGIKRSVQMPIELGYKAVCKLAGTSPEAQQKAEMLGLMVNEPNIDTQALRVLQVPTLVIAGTKDMVLEEHTRLIAQSLPNAQLVLLPGNHFIASKSPEAFNAAVETFLSAKDHHIPFSSTR